MLIITGQLAPGSRVTEPDLTGRLGVSRTPVREALNRLERDGFVVARPRNGFSIMTIDVVTVEEAFDMRALLEIEATRLTARGITDQGRAMLRSLIAECDALAVVSERTLREDLRELQIGIDLHRVIARLSGNRLLANILDGILDRCQAYVWLDVTGHNNFASAREEHREIVEAICRSDEKASVELTRKHILEAREGILNILRRRRSLHDILSDPA